MHFDEERDNGFSNQIKSFILRQRGP